MKYRRLSIQELEILEKDFVQFLAANHITAEDWIKLKSTNLTKVDQLIEIFSDIVVEKTLKNLKYLEFIAPKDIKSFYCGENEIHLRGIRMEEGATGSFLEMQLPLDLVELVKKEDVKLQIYSGEKAYTLPREQEIFQMLENGCLIAKEGNLFNLLKALKA